MTLRSPEKTSKVLSLVRTGILVLSMLSGCSTPTPKGPEPVAPVVRRELLPAVGELLILGQRALEEKRLQAARAHVERAYRLEPRNPEVLLLMAEVAEAEGQHDDSCDWLEKILSAVDELSAIRKARYQRLSNSCHLGAS